MLWIKLIIKYCVSFWFTDILQNDTRSIQYQSMYMIKAILPYCSFTKPGCISWCGAHSERKKQCLNCIIVPSIPYRVHLQFSSILKLTCGQTDRQTDRQKEHASKVNSTEFMSANVMCCFMACITSSGGGAATSVSKEAISLLIILTSIIDTVFFFKASQVTNLASELLLISKQ